MRRRLRLLSPLCLASSLLLGSLPQTAQAQLAVIDAANLRSNTMTSLQTTISAVESVLQTGYMLLELEPFEDLVLDGTFGADLAELDGILGEVSGILFDLRTIQLQAQRLFSLESAPDSTRLLRERLLEIRIERAKALARARDVQTLPVRITNVITRIERLWARILEVIGAKQTGQQLQSMTQQLTHISAQTQVIQAAYNQAILTDASERPVVEQAISLINEQIMVDWPK
jgi:hypothetical protein